MSSMSNNKKKKNHVRSNFISRDDQQTLSDLDDDDDDDDDDDGHYEDSGSEPEPQMGMKPSISISTSFVEPMIEEKEKESVDGLPRHLILGDFELTRLIDCEDHILCCQFSSMEDVFAVGFSHGTIKIFSKTGQFQYILSDNDTKSRCYPVTSVKFYSNRESDKSDHSKMLAATYTAGFVKVWHYPTRQCVWTFDESSRQALALDFNSNYTRLFVAGSDCAINSYDFLTKKLVDRFQASGNREEMDGHRNRIHAIRCHPIDDSLFLSGGWDDTIHYWDQRTIHSEKHFSGPHICGDSLDIIKNYQVILTGSWRRDSTLQIWDFSTGELMKDAFGKNANSMLYTTKFGPKDEILCSGNDQNEAIIYDYNRLKMIGGITNLENAVYSSDRDVHRGNLLVGSGRHLFLLTDTSKSNRRN